ncbi:MAG: adenylyl-sulfate kinase [Proteobacteria bacterium]|nr:adenylyl-sulfate kinase [Pseudomonadota bacterium]
MTGILVWFTGLPASGKTTLAGAVRARLAQQEVPACLLDSDHVRSALWPDLDYGPAARDQFYARLVRLGAFLAEQGLVVLVAATAHRREYRTRARESVAHLIEVHVRTSIETCESRDFKGLYSAARSGEIADLPGLGADYEVPGDPEITASGGRDDQAVDAIVQLVERLTGSTEPQSGASPPPGTVSDRGADPSAVQLESALDLAMSHFEAFAVQAEPTRSVDYIGVFLRAAAFHLKSYRQP